MKQFRLNAVEKFTVKIPSGGIKACAVRYPTDDEWCRRARGIKIIRTALGRDKSKTDAPGQLEADCELFERIRLDEPRQEFDQHECAEFVKRIDAGRVQNAECQSGQFVVALALPGDVVTTHSARMPMQREMDEYETASSSWINGKRHMEITTSLEPAGRLYDAIVQTCDGYAAGVPITHKYLVVREVLDQVEAIKAELDDPEV